MKTSLIFILLAFGVSAFAQSATVDISLTPAGSFKVKSADVKGVALKKGDHVQAQNIVVGLKNVETGISLRDTHTKKHLEVEKFPAAVLVSATGRGGKGEGVIKIRGIEKKISGTYKIDGSNLVASFPLKLSDFGLDHLKYMGVGVDDAATVHVTVPIKAN